MPLTAKIAFRFLWRLAAITIICLGGCLFCLYDGAVRYPQDHDRLVAYQDLRETVDQELRTKDKGLRDDEFFRRWEKLAADHGWTTKKPKNQIDIIKQYVMAACLVVPGLLYLYLFLRSRKRWIECSVDGLRTSWGQQFPFNRITTLNKTKWKTKGIAVIRYQENSRQRRLALDDWKYDAPATKAILCEVEARIDPTKIVGGAPETPPQAEPAT
jgi:hypothetical protein